MVGEDLKSRLESAPAACAAHGEEALRIEGATNLVVRRGEIVGLAGLAGAGRTELLEWLFGAARDAASRIVVNGRPALIRNPRDAIRHGIGLVPDDRKGKGLVLGASLADNIALPGRRDRLFLQQRRRAP